MIFGNGVFPPLPIYTHYIIGGLNMADKWIRFVDEANYNLTEIMKEHECSIEKAQEIAEEWFNEREPGKTIYTTNNLEDTVWEPEELRVPITPEEILNTDKTKYDMSNLINLIDVLKDMCAGCNIESISIDENYTVTMKF